MSLYREYFNCTCSCFWFRNKNHFVILCFISACNSTDMLVNVAIVYKCYQKHVLIEDCNFF